MPLRCLRHGHLRRIHHILNEYPVPRRRVVDENVGHRSDQLAVLNDGGARHECGQVGTTVFYGLFTIASVDIRIKRVYNNGAVTITPL